MFRPKVIFSLVFVILTMVAWPAAAHDIYANGGFLAGAIHPFLGLDHLLTIFTASLIGMQLGGRARVSVPLAFLLFFIFGDIIGLLQVPMPWVEPGIALSGILLGLALLMGRDVPLSFAQALVGIFALFHGHAHGAEIPVGANPVWYTLGISVGTVAIMLFGGAVAWYLSLIDQPKPLLRGLGGIITSLGLLLWFF